MVNNFIKNFIEEQKKLSRNKEFLKKNILIDNFETALNNDIYLQREIHELKNQISIQKGRITRQTNEQNKESQMLDKLFDKLIQLEKRITIKNGKSN